MNIKEAIAQNSTVSKVSYAFYKAKPTVCVVAGLIGTAGAVFLAWRAGKKTDVVIEEVKNDISEVKAKRPKEVTDAPTGKTYYLAEEGQLEKSEYNIAFTKVCLTAAYKLGKLFAPAVGLEIASVVTVAYGYGLLNERFVATAQLAQAYAVCLSAYRKTVRNEVGEEKERQLYYGLHEEVVEEPELDENGNPKVMKNGKPKMIKTKKEVLDEELAKHSPFARVFDAEYCSQFEVDSETGEENVWYNGKLVPDVEKMFNSLIAYRPYKLYTLNDIYDWFKFDKSGEGQIVGWHCTLVNGKPVFDIGDPEGIKIFVFPVYYRDENGWLKKSYIMDFNLDIEKNNILGFFPKVQRTVKEINGQA